jgi:hypothetical protein
MNVESEASEKNVAVDHVVMFWNKVDENTIGTLEQGTSVLVAVYRGYEELCVEQAYITSDGWLHQEGVEHLEEDSIKYYMALPDVPKET